MKQVLIPIFLAGFLSGCVYSAGPGYGYGGSDVTAYVSPPPIYVAPPRVVYVPPPRVIYVPPPPPVYMPPPMFYGPPPTVVIGIGRGWHHRHWPPPPGRWRGGPPFPP